MRETRTAQSSVFDFYTQHEFGAFLSNLSDRLDKLPKCLTLLENDLNSNSVKATGRKGLSVETILRCMLLKHITQVSYEQLAFHLADSPTYRAFARLSSTSAPKKSALSENIRRIQPQTLEAIVEYLNQTARKEGRLKPNVIRIDSTVVQSNIINPSDSQLLNDGIRVLSRLFAKSQHSTGIKLRFTDHRKKARLLAGGIFDGKASEKKPLYHKLLSTACQVIRQSERALSQGQEKALYRLRMPLWLERVEHYKALRLRVIDQTERRVIQGEQVPATEKLYSLFETHTDIIIKDRRGIYYGHKINLATDAHGLITVLRIEEGNPADTAQYLPMVEAHKKIYGQAPQTTVADGGYASASNIEAGKKEGVQKVVFHKKKGIGLSAMGIKQKPLEKLRNFRAGIEGNISELKRAFGAGKATWKGEDGFKAYVWSSVISYNLTRWVRMCSG